MAARAPHDGRASALPLSAVLASIPSYPRPVIERLVGRLIEHLDEQDSDPDLELNGDEADGTNAEDEEGNHCGHLLGLGCPISDPDCGIEDLPHDDLGEAEPEEGIIPPRGAYGVDQRKIVPPSGWGTAWRQE